MMLHGAPDDPLGTAVARLTPKERECLDRWLSHATAKEIALELGITHHAVEKRLKSARAKLGVTSTLDAARLLAAAEGYGQAVSQSPELEEGASAGDLPATPGLERPTTAARRLRVLAGVSLMSLILLAAAFISTADQQKQAVSPSRTTQVATSNRGSQAGAVNFDAAFERAFNAIDKDRNGYLEGAEVVNADLGTTRVATGTKKSNSTNDSAFAGFDTNKDGRVSRAEFIGDARSDDDHR
jgi:DNA-binding CsgD family transcriptional regulator